MEKEASVADYLAHFLSKKGVPNVFVLSGGMIAFLIDAIYRLGVTNIINTRHEQSAGFAAEAGSRVAGVPNVAMGTSGPGATNLITAIGSAFFDSTPTIFITGQVHSEEIRKNFEQRQNGFQELDIVKATEGLTKYAVRLEDAKQFPELLDHAWTIAVEGRPGPVLIDIPIDLQQQNCIQNHPQNIQIPTRATAHGEAFKLLAERLSQAKRPLVLAGGGIRAGDSLVAFRKFVEKLQLPVVHSLMGKDVLPTAHTLNIGFIGSYGNRWANRALSRADLLIVLGSRLDVRQTGSDLLDFQKNKFITRVDVDSNELTGRVKGDLNFHMGLNEFFSIAEDVEFPVSDSLKLLKEVERERIAFSAESEQENELLLSPDECIKYICKLSADVDGFCIDVGQHQMWAAQSIELLEHQRFITSGGMGAMGFSIPAAIGAASTSRGRWVTVTGDGCMQLSIGELQTIIHYNLPITIFVINNNQHGMVAQFQDENLKGRYISTRIGYSTPDFCAVAKAYGMSSCKVAKISDFEQVKNQMKNSATQPLLVEILIENSAKALPKLDRFTKLSEL